MNTSDNNNIELICFSGNGPLFSLSKRIINSIPYSYIYEQSEEELRTNDGNIFLDYRETMHPSMYMSYKYMKYINEYMENCCLDIKEEEIKNIDISLLENEMYSVFGEQGREAANRNMMGNLTVFIDSKVIEKKCYETPLLNWLASENNFKANEFHKYCDFKCPTVTLIKHIDHNNKINIFGGYTDQYWESSSGILKSASKEFLFTLSNEHNIPPTQYDILDPNSALYCYKDFGPCFLDICIIDDCHNSNNNCINGDDAIYSHGLTPQKASLFVNTAGPQEQNRFTVDDYEVYELIPNPDLYLPNSILITKEMGIELSRWFDKNKEWELLYRCSDEKRSVKKWHEKCDEKESLVIIEGKGKDGQSYIFGGYTSVGWGKNHSDMENLLRITGFRADSKAFLFSLTNPNQYNYTKLSINREYTNSALISNDSYAERTFHCGIYLSTDINEDRFIIYSSISLYGEDPVYISPYPELGNSFFVNTNQYDERNEFYLINFEVFTSKS
ncbi:hypothetical protein WA158_000816 [Blastocystis sp. Blastoise]